MKKRRKRERGTDIKADLGRMREGERWVEIKERKKRE